MKRGIRVAWVAALTGAAAVLICQGLLSGQDGGNPPSRFGKFTSRRWAYGEKWKRENLAPVENPNPDPEPLPRRDHPFDVAVCGDGTKVYVSLLGTELRPGSEVAVFDVAKGEVARRIALRPAGETGAPASGPFRLTMHPGGRFLMVTNRFSSFASVIDTQTDAVVSEIPLDYYGQGAVFDPSGKTAWVADRYLDEVFQLDVKAGADGFQATLRETGGLDEKAFFAEGGIHQVLTQSCGAAGCHDVNRGGFVAGADPRACFESALLHIRPGRSAESRLLRATVRSRDGGTADIMPLFRSHAKGTVVFAEPKTDAGYQAIAKWIDGTQEGPGIPVGNPRSKPKVLALGSDGRFLYVGNTGTQDISIGNTKTGREVGGIYVQNVVNDLKIHRSEATGHDWLVVTTMGIGFGVAAERDPWGGESWDKANPAAQYSVWRDLASGKLLPRAEQETLGPFDAVDGTAGIKFRDIQNDLVVVDLDALNIPQEPPAAGLSYLLLANRYESHRGWVRYTSDTAESTYGDIKGDIAPDLMRVVGALPEKMVMLGDRVFVTMQGTNEVQELRMNTEAADPSDILVPVRTWPTGVQPIGIAAGRPGTPSEGKLFVANSLGGTLSILDLKAGDSREAVVDPSILRLPVPATNAERGEFFAHTALFSADRDTSCVSCHYLDMGDGRPWGVSQVVGQEFLSDRDAVGQLVIGGAMLVPQQRGLFAIQPFFLEGTLSAFEPRSMIMEHCPADDFRGPNPQGDFTALEAHTPIGVTNDVQSNMDASTSTEARLEVRRDAMFQRLSLKYFGKSFTLRDFQRFVGEWQIREPRLLPNPFDRESASVKRGREIFNNPQVGCVSCHVGPTFTRKDFPDNPEQSLPPLVSLSARDGSFTLISMNRLDAINGVARDLEPSDGGREERKQGHFTTLQLRGIWDRPPVFLHNGMARTLREIVAVPGQPALGWFKYEPLLGGVPERPGRKEVGFNETFFFTERLPKVKAHLKAEGRIGSDTHGGTSQLTPQQIDDLVNFMESIE
ncbi:MAG: hypothetical protein K8T20_13055 [Planctomycetes bacterium]|nr:hypothetical protein [Planctomycetota bacterium]